MASDNNEDNELYSKTSIVAYWYKYLYILAEMLRFSGSLFYLVNITSTKKRTFMIISPRIISTIDSPRL